jgi:TonB family protein
MKYILTILYISFVVFALCLGQETKKESSKSFKSDSLVTSDYFPPDPKVLFKPQIIVPNELKPLNGRVKVIVRMIVDTSGHYSHYEVIRSSNHKFDETAIKYAKMYKFEYQKPFGQSDSMWIDIPIVFHK